MRLSISSTDERLPALAVSRVWLVALALAVLALGGWEALWRAQGFRPKLQDSPRLWALTRGRVTSDPRQFVFVGDSRIQLDIDLQVFAAAFPGPPPVQLAISNADSFPIILDLADDPAFRGVLVSSPTQIIYAQRKGVTEMWKQPEAFARLYRTWTPADAVEEWLASILQRTFVFPLVEPVQALKKLRAGQPLEQTYDFVSLTFDRGAHADFSRTDVTRSRNEVEKVVTEVDWSDTVPEAERQQNLRRMEDAVRRIQARGGQVVFVNLPISGAIRAGADRDFPRERYWDPWARSTAAITINFVDYPTLTGFSCPDSSHLDQRDASRFSAALAEIIKAKLGNRFK